MYRLCCMVSHDVVAISIWNPATSKPPFVKGPSCLMLDTDTFDVSPIHLIYQNHTWHYKYHALPCIDLTDQTLLPIVLVVFEAAVLISQFRIVCSLFFPLLLHCWNRYRRWRCCWGCMRNSHSSSSTTSVGITMRCWDCCWGWWCRCCRHRGF